MIKFEGKFEGPPSSTLYYDEAITPDMMITKLVQIHHQFPDGHIEMVRQCECSGLDALTRVMGEVKHYHQLPEEAQWLFVMEGSKHFVYKEKP